MEKNYDKDTNLILPASGLASAGTGLLAAAWRQEEQGWPSGRFFRQWVSGLHGYTYTVDGKFNGMVFALVSIPISDWGKASRKQQRLEHQVQKAQNEKDYLNSQLLTADKAGLIPLSELLNTQTKLHEASEGYIGSQIEYSKALTEYFGHKQ